MEERRSGKERRADWVCIHHEACHQRVTNTERSISGVKKLLLVGIGLIMGMMSYYAYNQDKRNEILLEQAKSISRIETILEIEKTYEAR